ncbi:hypothetical protein LEN26_018084 [Aphanomyces euteiches]|nr:hypothetical protein LEN26_018084 [Aphanomyces euteiches]KAH9112089.1 hypothetical protein AeMF1_013528 [Aphanomyces euteiches]KAH9195494.1 hypothetical protein AeNC1_002527 [Aphanomyces euteiches]
MNMPASDACGPADAEHYNMGLHIGSMFIVFGVSLVGCMFPVVSPSVPFLTSSRRAIQLLHAFGFGAILSTALVHVISPAIAKLSNPCLHISYDCLALPVVIATMIAMQVLETELTVAMIPLEASTTPVPDQGRPHDVMGDNFIAMTPQPSFEKAENAKAFGDTVTSVGIAIYSIVLGISLGVSTGSTFSTQLTAICFYQLYQGMTVCSSSATAFSSFKASTLSALLFSATAPIGIVIGILVSKSYTSGSATAFAVQGSLYAIAGGILLYGSLVQLVTYQLTTNASFHRMSEAARCFHYICVALGAAAMALVGK